MKFVDIFCGLGAFSHALSSLGHECVAACDNNPKTIQAYIENFPNHNLVACKDIRLFHEHVPEHNILCAGFPCQPFSKSGRQLGFTDKERGGLVYSVLRIAETHLPEYIVLENVGNLAKHNNGITWLSIKEELSRLGYTVRSTQHVTSGGGGMLSPHSYGFPQKRERFFALCRRGFLPENPFPVESGLASRSLDSVLVEDKSLTIEEKAFSTLSNTHLEAIELWQEFIHCLPNGAEDLPSAFPLWSEEFGADYPFQFATPYSKLIDEFHSLEKYLESHSANIDYELAKYPPYAREKKLIFPRWKRRFLQQNRDWFDSYYSHISPNWLARLRALPHTYRKLEWNVKG